MEIGALYKTMRRIISLSKVTEYRPTHLLGISCKPVRTPQSESHSFHCNNMYINLRKTHEKISYFHALQETHTQSDQFLSLLLASDEI